MLALHLRVIRSHHSAALCRSVSEEADVRRRRNQAHAQHDGAQQVPSGLLNTDSSELADAFVQRSFAVHATCECAARQVRSSDRGTTAGALVKLPIGAGLHLRKPCASSAVHDRTSHPYTSSHRYERPSGEGARLRLPSVK